MGLDQIKPLKVITVLCVGYLKKKANKRTESPIIFKNSICSNFNTAYLICLIPVVETLCWMK